MKKHSTPKSNVRKLEGEGSYTAARAYDKNVRSFVARGNTQSLADKARRAVDGEEGEQLRQAERRGKAGPKSGPKRSG
jgi:hypothetical protein